LGKQENLCGAIVWHKTKKPDRFLKPVRFGDMKTCPV
jgi:hypothetical protein